MLQGEGTFSLLTQQWPSSVQDLAGGDPSRQVSKPEEQAERQRVVVEGERTLVPQL